MNDIKLTTSSMLEKLILDIEKTVINARRIFPILSITQLQKLTGQLENTL